MALFLGLILLAVVLGIVGFVVKGLLYLFAIGVAVLVVAVLLSVLRLSRWRRRRASR